MLNYSKFIYRGGPKSNPGGPTGKPSLSAKPKVPDFNIASKTPKALKSGLERYLKKLTPKEQKILDRYVRYVLEKYDQKLDKKYNKIPVPTLGKQLKMSLKARVVMAQILKKLGRRGEYYIDRYIKFLKLKLAKEYKKEYSKRKGRKGNPPKPSKIYLDSL